MNQPLPEVVCKLCNKLQVWRNQKDCVHCGNRLSHWRIAQQLNPPADTRPARFDQR